ncbi:helix-turn-helix transcriptional regulator [Chryseobacterium gallinarum]|uniref:helix-turn-helix domain-containing protein n=1 Tax=Chryseobacterium gallinarum TaxID=1324352 RepID=UPI002025047F|nr:AraC family transcriptional regulator [Chryseobacterium gallinarum]MCL8538631.1 helix-turn-helix transcriptional regulator [Chryseobacterium gallinarum]
MIEKINTLPIEQVSIPEDFNDYAEIIYHDLKDNATYTQETSHTFFTIFLFENAKGKHLIDGQEFPIKEFQMNLVFPNQAHQYECERLERAHQLIVPKQILDTFGNYLMFPFSFYKNHPSFELSEETFYRLHYEFRSIDRELKENENVWEIVLFKIRIITLMISKEAYRLFFIDSENAATKQLADFCKLVLVNFKTERSVRFYANQLSLSPNYLNIICKKYFHKTASSVINNELILEIKIMLINSNKTIKEIAFDLGFKDLPAFSYFFSNNAGMSPRDFVMKFNNSSKINFFF